MNTAQSAAEPYIWTPDRLPRACLDPIQAHVAATREEVLTLLEAELRCRDAALAAGEQEEAAAQKDKKERQQETHIARYESAVFFNQIEDGDLHQLRGHKTIEAYILAKWPGGPMSRTWKEGYLRIARFIPEEVVLSLMAGPTLLGHVARLQGGAPGELLCAAILTKGLSRSLIGRATDVALTAQDLQLPEDLVLERIRAVLAGRDFALTLEEFKAGFAKHQSEMCRLMKKARAQGFTDEDLQISWGGFPPPDRGPQGGGAPDGGPERRAHDRPDPAPAPPVKVVSTAAPAAAEQASPTATSGPGPGTENGGPAPDAPVKVVSTEAPAAAAPDAPPFVPPPRPFVDPQGEAVLPVYVHPSLIQDMTRAERLTYRIFALAASLTVLLTEWLRLRLQEYEETFLDLQFLVYHQIEDTREVLFPLIPLLGPAIENARAAEPDELADEPADLLFEWVLHDNCDPLHEPDPNPSEKLLFTVLGQLPLFNKAVGELLDLREGGGDDAALDLRLLRRWGDLLGPLKFLMIKSSANLSSGASKAYLAQQAEAEKRAAIEAVRGPRESRIVVVGAETLPPAHGIIGKTVGDDRLVTWSFWEPSLTWLLGDRGKGKSHFIRVMVELMTLRPQGLGFLKRPQCPILIDAECTQGEGRFEMLEGFFANHDPAQLHQLHHFYQTNAHNVAFRRAKLLCHRKQVAYYQKLLSPYVERGLFIGPLGLGIPDLGSFAFEVMLEWAVGGDQNAVYKNLIQSLVARHGDELTLDLLRQAVQTSGLRGTTKQTVLELFDLLGGMYSETESVMQHVGEEPVFTLLRGRYLPKNFVNPMQAVLFNAFCRSAANGDPPRTVIFEEWAKALARNLAMQRFAMNFTEEMRHRPVSAVGGLQHLEKFAKGLWAAADNHVVFGLSNPQDVRRGKVELYGMRHLRFLEMAAQNMPTGRARIFSRRGNTPELSRGLLVDIRPTLISAGGRTLNAEDGEDEP